MNDITKNKIKTYKWYLILSIIFSSINILSVIIFYIPPLFDPVIKILKPIVFGWAILNLVMFVVFIWKKIERVALWLPVLYIFDTIFSYVVGFLVRVYAAFTGVGIEILRNPFIALSAIIFQIFALVLAINLILRKNDNNQ